MRTSESISKIAPALQQALAGMEEVDKDGINPHFKSAYATLPAVLQLVRPKLAEHGICIIQSPAMRGNNCVVVSRLVHNSGEWIEGEAEAPLAKQDPQGVGSAITYLRRYSIMALCCIGAEDDDANAASQPPKPQPKPEQPKQEPPQAPVDWLKEIGAAKDAATLSAVWSRINQVAMKMPADKLTALTAAKDAKKAQLGGKNA